MSGATPAAPRTSFNNLFGVPATAIAARPHSRAASTPHASYERRRCAALLRKSRLYISTSGCIACLSPTSMFHTRITGLASVRRYHTNTPERRWRGVAHFMFQLDLHASLERATHCSDGDRAPFLMQLPALPRCAQILFDFSESRERFCADSESPPRRDPDASEFFLRYLTGPRTDATAPTLPPPPTISPTRRKHSMNCLEAPQAGVTRARRVLHAQTSRGIPTRFLAIPQAGIRVEFWGPDQRRAPVCNERINRAPPRRRRSIDFPVPRQDDFTFVAGWSGAMLDSRRAPPSFPPSAPPPIFGSTASQDCNLAHSTTKHIFAPSAMSSTSNRRRRCKKPFLEFERTVLELAFVSYDLIFAKYYVIREHELTLRVRDA
ncbi:hypothetical protein FB451DRAFT_1398750 [Mycena latifolia]|nr:hypothetical protein FB451DRAFT_1398750 [Mycena latifolia]